MLPPLGFFVFDSLVGRCALRELFVTKGYGLVEKFGQLAL
jgi:hypothetical protein